MAARKKAAAAKKKSASKSSGARKPTDAIALLRADHELVQDLFGKYEKARGEDRKSEIARQICMELTVHATIEEEIFYPAVREAIDDDDLMDEATVEHKTAKDLIAELENGSPEDDLYDAKVKVLSEYIKHHVKEEHEEMFPKARKSKVDLKALGEQLEARKAALQAGGAAKGGGSRGGGLKGSASKRGSGAAQEEGLVGRVSRSLGLGGMS